MRLRRLIPYMPVILFLSGYIPTFSQSQANDTPAPPGQITDKYYAQVTTRLGSIEQKVEERSAKALQEFSKQEQKLFKKLRRIDSNAARQLMSDAAAKYARLQEQLKGPQKLLQYVPYLDTLKNSLKFLDQHPQVLSQAKGIKEKLQSSLSKVNGLENELQKAEDIRQFLKERKQFLKDQLSRLGFAKELMKLNKQAYYYGAQINEFKEAIKDRKKAEQKVIGLLSKTKFFQDFMQRNGMLAGMFRMPGQGDPANMQAILSGLQTRTQVQQLLQQQIATGGPNAMAQVQQNITEARTQLDKLKDKINSFRSGGGASDDMPDFRPNDQKTKPFLRRLELGTNIQTSKGSNLFPITTDLGLSAGYKLNDKSTLGIGLSYKIGWGQGWRDISITHQGVGLRSFVDWKIKGSFSLTGGYEMNYRSAFTRVEQLQNLSAWQQSGLAGLSKTVSIRSKFFKKTKLQLLFDFLSFQQVPKTQPVLFRVGYNF